MVIFTNTINLYDNILINKYQGLITCNRLTPLQIGWFSKLAATYERFDGDHSQAFWESTHCLWISKEQARTSPFLASYYNVWTKRRGRGPGVAGRCWSNFSVDESRLMRSRHLLGPLLSPPPRPRCVEYWFPGREKGSNPVNLLEALWISDSAFHGLRSTDCPAP